MFSLLRAPGGRDGTRGATHTLGWTLMVVLAMIATMTLGVTPAHAALTGPGLDPTGSQAGGIPAQGSCGVGDYGEYVKFTTGGTTVDNYTATTTASKPYTAKYSSNIEGGFFQITSLVDDTGKPVYFSSAVGGASSANPVWTFAPTSAPSPVLSVPVNANFSQFALCVYHNQTFQVKKVVSGTTTTQTFPIHITCTLGTTLVLDTTVTLGAGAVSDPITVSRGSVCSATDSVTGYTTTTTGPLGPITADGGLITVTNTRRKASLTITKNQDGGVDRVWHFSVSCSNDFGETYSGTAQVTGSGTATLTGIPTGLSCKVTETEANSGGFSTTVSATGGTVVIGSNTGLTFTNTRDTTSLKIKKTQVGGADRDWTFNVSCSNAAGDTWAKNGVTITGTGTATLSGIPTGLDCTVTETGLTGVPFTTDHASQSVNVGTTGGSVEFTNTRDTTSLRITKTQVGGADRDWTFSVNCGPNAAGDTFTRTGVVVNGSGTTTVSGIPTGLDCTVTETGLTGVPFTTDHATDSTNVGTTGGSVSFTNTRNLTTLTITKVQKGGGDRVWNFDVVCSNAAGDSFKTSVSLTGSDSTTITSVPTGLDCKVSESGTDAALFTAAPDAVQNVNVGTTGGSVTFTNTRNTTSLTITKTQSGGADRMWTFAVHCAANTAGDSFDDIATVTGSGKATVTGIPTGLDCTVTETGLTGVPFTANHGDVTVNVGTTGGAVAFTNTRDTTQLMITKNQVGGADRTWTFTVNCSNAAGDSFKTTATVTGSGTTTVSGVPTNTTCTVTESGTDIALFTADPGTTQTVAIGNALGAVTFTNTRKTTDLTITKVQNGGADQVWHFTVTCAKNAAGDSFSGTATVTGSGSTTVTGIPTGLTCTVKETEANASPFDTVVSPASGAVAVPGTVTFTNTKRADASVVKTQNGGAPTYVYTFTLTGGPDNVNLTRSTTVGSTAPLDFGLLKPGTYMLCETGVSAGTKSGVESMPGATIDATLGNVCAPVTLSAGNNLTLNIDNKVGEGGRRTIGYWKNWNTCTSNAGQLANAAKTGKKLLDDVLPLTLGNVTVTTCKQGVAILTNSAGKYAENALASQLLAAEANVKVGGAPQAILDAIAQANALLKTVGYTGASNSAIIGANSPYRAQAVALATLLDQFNNGQRG